MADKLRHRGRLTRQIVEGLSLATKIDPQRPVQRFTAVFYNKGDVPIVKMRLLAALQSVTYDIASNDTHDWSRAIDVQIVRAEPGDTDLLRLR